MKKIVVIPMKGSIGSDVVIVQTQLKEMGYDPGSIDGVFGSKTAAAISKFQKKNGLNGSGVIGPKTLILLGIEIGAVSPVTGKEAIAKDLIGKKGRHLHPALRLLMESKIFPNGVVPECFIKGDIAACVVAVLNGMEALNIREVGGNNRGKLVGFIQATVGHYDPKGTGDPWCMSAMQCLIAFIEDYFQVESPLIASEGCVATARAAMKIPGLTTQECEGGTIFIGRYGTTEKGHTGGVIKPKPLNRMETAEGNTGDFSIRDGDGFFFKTRHQRTNGKLKTLCFAYIYPNNKLPGAA